MRILVLSDIHANLVALEAVLQDARGDYDTLWCLGDSTGYGPRPNEVLQLLRDRPHMALVGNHDLAAAGLMSSEGFNATALMALDWTRAALSNSSIEYLGMLQPAGIRQGIALAHGSPRDPVWEYVNSSEKAFENLMLMEQNLCLVGHSHKQVGYALEEGAANLLRRPGSDMPLKLGWTKTILNPGSVGQPRDGDPRAAYAILNLKLMEWESRRVEYDVSATQQQMRAENLPESLAARLETGV